MTKIFPTQVVIISGGGGSGAAAWGPTFGPGNSNDNSTSTIARGALSIPQLGYGFNLTARGAISVSALAANYTGFTGQQAVSMPSLGFSYPSSLTGRGAVSVSALAANYPSIFTGMGAVSLSALAILDNAFTARGKLNSTAVANFVSTSTFTAPITGNYTVECFGSGQGGFVGGALTSGNGGIGGSYARSVLALTATTVYTVTVGAAVGAGVTGLDSWFNTSAIILAKGGNSASANIGTTTFTGGAGGVGATAGSGGGGGASASSTQNGNAGGVGTGGAATSPDGGAGGNGGAGGVDGSPGSVPGGGGGGGGFSATAPGAGGSSARGQVKISWTIL